MKRRTDRIERIKDDLRKQIETVQRKAGDRLFSNNSVAKSYGISYVTAHRLMRELEAEGLLVRKRRSGSYTPGVSIPSQVRLIFSPKSRRVDNANRYTLDFLQTHLNGLRINTRVTYWNQWRGGASDEYFVFLGNLLQIKGSLQKVKRALYLDVNATGLPADPIPPLDVICFDNRQMAELVNEFFTAKIGPEGRLAFFCDPPVEHTRFMIFEELAPIYKGRPIRFFEDTMQASPRGVKEMAVNVAKKRFEGVFCTSIGLATQMQRACTENNLPMPRILCCDSYNFSARKNLSAIMFPYKQMAETAADIICRRMEGDVSPPFRLVLPTQLVERLS